MFLRRILLFVAAAASLGLAASALAQAPEAEVAIPDTPSGRQLAAWLEAFNHGDDAALQAYVAEAWPGMPNPGLIVESRRDSGGFTLLGIESAGETQVVARVEESNWPGQSLRMTLNVAAEPPHQITGALLQPTPPDPDAPPVARLTEAEVVVLLQERLETSSFAGAVILAKNGEPVLSYASGEADRENGVANTLDTKFRIGSMNKMFTAVSILQLVEDGRIDLDAPIGTYLTDYPNTDLASRVTVRHLLTHSGGTGDIFAPEYFARRLETRTHADYVALFGARDVAFEPGDHFAYSNYGFVLLGAIVEAVTGGSYYDYVDEHIYAPAGMTSSGSFPEDADVPGRSVGYTRQPAPPPPGTAPAPPQPSAEPRPNTDTLPYRGMAAGGGYATVGDLVRFGEALRTGAILSPESLEQATSVQIDAPPAGYGFGFGVFETDGVKSYGHSGGAPGMRAELRVFPESGYALVYASNTDTAIGSRLMSYVGARLPAE
jgi:CubicO group peptidase (beta-lactamase class C family)